MTADQASFPDPDSGPPVVGSFVPGPPDGPRQVVRWADQFAAYYELQDGTDPAQESFLSLYHFPPVDYCRHFAAAGYTPRGYAGPAGCRALVFDIDRAGDLGSALTDARSLLQFLLARYGPKLDDGVGAYFSGAKGFHLTLELLPGFAPSAAGTAACKRLALAIAAAAGVQIDPGCYDHQRLVRLPNTRHPRTGLFKRFLTHEELLTLDVPRITDLARHPAGFPVPACGEFVQELQDDWDRATAAVTATARRATPSSTSHPVVPKFVRDFIGWQDVQDPGRAVTLFRCAAVLAEAGTPDSVIAGLLEEPALKSGLDPAEVRRQISTGITHGRGKGGRTG